jgi:hypothetical protein
MSLKFPVGGPKQPVYALMRKHGFQPSAMSDKLWSKPGINVSIFGVGSMARIKYGPTLEDATECALDDFSSILAKLESR